VSKKYGGLSPLQRALAAAGIVVGASSAALAVVFERVDTARFAVSGFAPLFLALLGVSAILSAVELAVTKREKK
jgi:hypothetical protein